MGVDMKQRLRVMESLKPGSHKFDPSHCQSLPINYFDHHAITDGGRTESREAQIHRGGQLGLPGFRREVTPQDNGGGGGGGGAGLLQLAAGAE